MASETAAHDIWAMLDWLQAAGVDAALDDAPHDWLARGAKSPGADFAVPAYTAVASSPAPATIAPARPASPAVTARTEPHRPRAATPLGLSEAEQGARRIAATATSLEALERALQNFDGCGLKATATKLCFYRGAAKADLMIIGEAPGRDEDLQGKPFVGRAGQLLDKMLAAIGYSEANVHITNIVYWRPPGNRTPTPQEALACRPFLERQIELVEPKVIVAAGGAAAKEVFGVAEGIMRLRGKWREFASENRKIAAIATLHPAYLLRTPAAKAMAWSDLLAIKSKLG